MRTREQEHAHTRRGQRSVQVSSQQGQARYRAGGKNRRGHSAGFGHRLRCLRGLPDPADHAGRLKEEQGMVEIESARNQLPGLAGLIRMIEARELVVSVVKPGARCEKEGSQ
jgi:hypothetical protein